MLSEILAKRKRIVVSGELYDKLVEHAKQKNVSVEQEVEDLCNVAIKALEFQHALKASCKGADQEL